LIAAAMWTLLYRDPAAIGLSTEEHAYLAYGSSQGTPPKTTFAEWRSLFEHRTTWVVRDPIPQQAGSARG
jgi:hypothetical protein